MKDLLKRLNDILLPYGGEPQICIRIVRENLYAEEKIIPYKDLALYNQYPPIFYVYPIFFEPIEVEIENEELANLLRKYAKELRINITGDFDYKFNCFIKGYKLLDCFISGYGIQCSTASKTIYKFKVVFDAVEPIKCK